MSRKRSVKKILNADTERDVGRANQAKARRMQREEVFASRFPSRNLDHGTLLLATIQLDRDV